MDVLVTCKYEEDPINSEDKFCLDVAQIIGYTDFFPDCGEGAGL